MRWCSIIGCRSSKSCREKPPGISFHEVPAREDARTKWLQAINRKDWLPKEHSSVCSLHFASTDFMDSNRRRKLKKDVVPSLFLVTSNSDTTELFEAQPCINLDVVTKKRADVPTSEQVSNEHGYISSSSVANLEPCKINEWKTLEVTTYKRQRSILPDAVRETTSCDVLNNDYPLYPCEEVEIIIDITENDSEFDDTPRNNLPIAQRVIEEHSYHSQEQELEVEVCKKAKKCTGDTCHWKRKCHLLKKRIEQLEKIHLEDLKLMRRRLGDRHSVNLRKIKECANGNNVLAHSLLDQIENFDRKSPRWSELTYKLSYDLREISSKAYAYLKRTQMLKLPARSSLQQYVAQMNKSMDATSGDQTVGQPNAAIRC